MSKYFTLNELALMTGLSTRTLRNYLKMELLNGEKIDGIWKFTEEEVDAFLSDSNVKPSIQAKKNAIVYDFLLDNHKKNNEICSVLDFCVGDDEATEISNFFCKAVTECAKGTNARFSFEKNGENVRVILKGKEDAVMEIMKQYYES